MEKYLKISCRQPAVGRHVGLKNNVEIKTFI